MAVFERMGHNKTATAEALGIHRETVRKLLKQYHIKPLATGRMGYKEPIVFPLPKKGEVKRYILTAAQNNTHVHKGFLDNLEAYANYLGAQLMISRFSYNRASYSGKSVKPGRGPTSDDVADLWYDRAISPYICDDPELHQGRPFALAPSLLWASNLNIIPTARRPLSGLETYSGMASGIFPHSTIALESVPTGLYEPTKMNYTTGCVTQRNYIEKKQGNIADFHHAYAAVVVEVNHRGMWWVRHINADTQGTFYDIPSDHARAVQVYRGKVYEGISVEALNWGDIHADEMEDWVFDQCFGDGGILDTLRPKYQLMHDVMSMTRRSHHVKTFGHHYKLYAQGREQVVDEVGVTADILKSACRDWSEVVIVPSNHDRHGDRWLDEADYRSDLPNAELFLEAQLERVRAIKSGESFEFMRWALEHPEYGGLGAENIRWLDRNESFVICGDRSSGIECGWHGDEGPNGSKGTTQGLLKVGRRINKGHDHTATIRDGVYSAGACVEVAHYMNGPSSHSVSHIVTYPNSKRSIITCNKDGWRA